MSVADAVRESRLAGLLAMRDVLAAAMDGAEPSVIAQVAARLQLLLAEIAELEAAAPEVSASDDIARELKAGLAGASVVQLAGRGRKRRAG